MKKAIKITILSLLLVLMITSCSTLGAIFGQLETKYTEYVLDETTDIYGHHETFAILVDKQTEGLAASDFATRILRHCLDGNVEKYAVQFREQDNVFNDGYYYMTLYPLIKIDDQVYDLSIGMLPEYQYAGDIRFKEVEIDLPAECVEALKTAENVWVQFYSVNDKDKLIQVGPEGLAAIKEFVAK